MSDPLTITILNDNTGTDEHANYTYLVRADYKTIASGRIIDHNPAAGWKALVREVVAPGMLEACALDWRDNGTGHKDVYHSLTDAILYTTVETGLMGYVEAMRWMKDRRLAAIARVWEDE